MDREFSYQVLEAGDADTSSELENESQSLDFKVSRNNRILGNYDAKSFGIDDLRADIHEFTDLLARRNDCDCDPDDLAECIKIFAELMSILWGYPNDHVIRISYN